MYLSLSGSLIITTRSRTHHILIEHVSDTLEKKNSSSLISYFSDIIKKKSRGPNSELMSRWASNIDFDTHMVQLATWFLLENKTLGVKEWFHRGMFSYRPTNQQSVRKKCALTVRGSKLIDYSL